MINDHVLTRFAPLGDRLLKPIYQDYSFANLPATFHYLLTGEHNGALLPPDCFGGVYPSPKKIVLFFVDGFGWQFWQRYAERSRLMRRVIGDGVLTPISALFPSTTAASVSTLNLGCLPARHAVFEWNMYVPAYGETIQSLAFATLGRRSISCVTKGYDPRDLMVEHETMHQRLARHGVRSLQLAHRNYARSPYNTIASAGAEVIAHSTLPEALVQLRHVLAATQEKALINLSWAGLDTAAHFFGPGSAVHDAEVTSFWLTLDALLADVVSPDTLFLFTSDHGHVGTDAADTLYINERWPELADCLAMSPTGKTIWPSGSPRDMFLHVEAERRIGVHDILAERLAGIADVLPIERAIAEGLFGAMPVCAELRRRLGDLLILPHLGHFIWWREPGIVDNTLHGHHGGLAVEELVTVLGVVDTL
jgi:Type I phosphodiesterase / nucleotide pyrophosphatase